MQSTVTPGERPAAFVALSFAPTGIGALFENVLNEFGRELHRDSEMPLAFADSAYVYLVSLERYSSADTVSSGWVIGFLFGGGAILTLAVEVEASGFTSTQLGSS